VVLILGGYGNTGRRLTRILTRRTEATVVVAGRDELRARRLADELNRKLGEERVLARVVDAARPGTLRDALGDVELLIVASSTARHAEGVARAALETGTDYVDVHYGSRKTRALRAMAAEVEAAGLCFMTDAGFHPGLPAVLVRHVGVSFERLETARVAAAMKVDWRGLDLAVETTREFVEELARASMRVYRDGAWRSFRWWSGEDVPTVDFGSPLGERTCVPMHFAELDPLPDIFPDLQELGFYMAGFGRYVDWVVTPAVAVLARMGAVGRALAGRWMFRALRRTAAPPFWTTLRIDAEGLASGRRTRVSAAVSHPDAYDLTAVPVAAAVLQLLDGSARRPGVWLQGLLVDPGRLLQDMARLGIELEEEWELGSAVGLDDP